MKAGRKPKPKKQDVIDALTKTRGNRTEAGKALGRCRQTVSKYIEEYGLVDFVDSLHQEKLDNLEDKAYEEAMSGNTALLIFLLKTQGHARGYQEKQYVESDNKVEIVVKRTDED